MTIASSGDGKTVIHIGLHKTATRFFQHQVFASMAAQGVLFNPPTVMAKLHALFLEPNNPQKFSDAQASVRHFRQQSPDAKLLISKPDIPGDMYDAYGDYEINLGLLHALFPEAHLIYVPRNPVDWLLSAYRQSLVKGASGPIETFLNFRNGEFQAKHAPLINGMRNIDALRLPFENIYLEARKYFGSAAVSVLCFEHVRKNKQQVFDHFSHLLGLPAITVPKPEKIKNRSFSALAITLFCGGNRRTSELHAAESVSWFVARYIHRPLRKLRANFIKHGWDALIYRDWDLLARNDMRDILKDHYREEYSRILQLSERTLGTVGTVGPVAKSVKEGPDASDHALTESANSHTSASAAAVH